MDTEGYVAAAVDTTTTIKEATADSGTAHAARVVCAVAPARVNAVPGQVAAHAEGIRHATVMASQILAGCAEGSVAVVVPAGSQGSHGQVTAYTDAHGSVTEGQVTAHTIAEAVVALAVPFGAFADAAEVSKASDDLATISPQVSVT